MQAAALADLALGATRATAALARDTHAAVSRTSFAAVARAPPLRAPARIVEIVERGIAGLVYGAIDVLVGGAEAVVGVAMRGAGAAASPAGRPAGESELERPAARAATGVLNGAVGDLLVRRGNPLATPMTLRERERPLMPVGARGGRPADTGALRLCIFIHGLGCTESVWLPEERRVGEVAAQRDDRVAVDYGALLARDLGYRPLYLRYNSGLALAENADALAALLAELDRSLERSRELVLVGHSMGGLLAVAAARAGAAAEQDWMRSLTHVICLGAPHGGAPLARAAAAASRVLAGVALPGVEVPARLLALRSAGVRDLARVWPGTGTLREHRLAATVATSAAHPLAALLGDAMVGVRSALGDAPSTATVGGVSHLRLTRDAAVYAQIRRWLSGCPE